MAMARMIASAGIAACLMLAGCGGPESAKGPATASTVNLKGDDALIASAEKISNAIGGCQRPDDAQVESRVVSLDGGSIVMVRCSQGAYSSTHRLFAVTGAEAPRLLSLPDYDTGGWFASDQASMADIDAGTGVLTTLRKSAGHGSCGSEGRFQWDGTNFVLQEMRWQDCGDPNQKGPPFPTIWPTQVGAAVDPNGATPTP